MKTLFRWIKRFFIVLWLIIILVLGAWILIDNSQPLSLTLLGFQLPEFSVGIYITAIFLLGIIKGLCVSYVMVQRRLFRQKRELRKAQKELEQLRTAHLKA